VEIPKIGLVMESVRVTRWLKKVGDEVQLGEPLLEVETEKSVVEIEAAVSGRLEKILAPVGQEAKVGDQVAWLDAAEGAPAPAPQPALPPRESAPAAMRASAPRTPADGRVRSTPAARRLAGERGLDLRRLEGTGPGGRVQLADVAKEEVRTAATTPALDPASIPTEMSSMQRALARAMTLSNATVPQFTVERSFDGTALRAARSAAPAVSVNDFLLHAVARALTEMPAMNATYEEPAPGGAATIVLASGTHVGLVVAVDGGLLVPVLHDVERLSLSELAARRRDTVLRALKGRLRREELGGATCSISNLGAQGPDRFAAMINPPESAILAVGRERDCVVARDGGFAIRPQSELTLTVDHRVASGRLAADFLARVVQILECREWRV
jgi:pyruvate dehydrogenase E2 component (dihydrolipoamide acetyltransferase)